MNSEACYELLNDDEKVVATKPLWQPFASHNQAPWVKVWFIGSGWCVSVGNESMPGGEDCETEGFGGERPECMGGVTLSDYTKNHAVIKSFTYGCSGGKAPGSDGIKVEILDEQGSEFCNFMTNIFPKNRDKKDPAQQCKMAFQFGWITSMCNGQDCKILSRQRICYPLQVDVSFVGGMVKFAISACNPAEALTEGVSHTVEPAGDDSTKRIKPAIEELFGQYDIKPLFLTAVSKVDCGGGSCFEALEKSCAENFNFAEPESYPSWEFFNNEGCFGQECLSEGSWKTNNKDPVTAASTWLRDKATKGDSGGGDAPPPRGFVVGGCNIIDTKNHIIFWESPLPDCKGISPPSMKNIGTFIVNGGACSNVLSFNPQINWQVANVTQGGNTSETNAKATPAVKMCDITGSGSPEILQVVGTTSEWYDKTAGDATAVGHVANSRAMPPSAAIEAELLIQGNPYLDDPLSLCAGVECSIIVINPFMLRPTEPGNCPDWLSEPPMNYFLSNKHWLICGVSHEIKEGSFTTTLKVWLATPGVDIDRTAQLGGPPGPILFKT